MLDDLGVNLAQYGYRPDDDCVFIRNYSESVGVVEALKAAGVVAEERSVVTFGLYNTTATEIQLKAIEPTV